MRINPAIFLILTLLLFLSVTGEASAAPARTLLRLGEFSQWVNLEYQYDGQATKTSQTFSSHQNYFLEEYNAQIAYTILDPYLWRGKLGAGVSQDQSYSSSTASSYHSSGANFTYNFSGALLERSPFPLHFFGKSELIQVRREFSNPYHTDLDTRGFDFLLKNRRLPFRFDYTRSTSDTSGLAADRTQESQTVNLQLSNVIGEISDSSFNVTVSDSGSRLKESDSAAISSVYNLTLRNQLRLSPKMAGRKLNSRIQTRTEARTQNLVREEIRTLTVDEQVTWPFGRALTAGSNYSFIDRETFRGKDRYHNGRVWVQHRLFESLTTQLDGDYRRDDLIAGREQNIAGSLGLLYQKKLPQDSSLQINCNQSYMVTDRDLGEVYRLIADEAHTVVEDPLVPGLLLPIVLQNGREVSAIIEVRNADSTVRLLPYVLDGDYRFDDFSGEIIIIPTGEINAGDELLISYVFMANPQITYATSSRGIAFNLFLFKSANRFYGNWLDSDQKLESGRADLVRLVDHTAYKLGFEAIRRYFSAAAEYEKVASDQDNHYTVKGSLRTSRRLGNGILTLYASDAYTQTSQNSFSRADQPDRSVKSLGAGGTYSSQLFNRAQLLCTAKYFNVSGDTVPRDDVSLGLNLRWNYGKLSLSLLSQLNWRMQPESTTRDEYLRLHITRHF